MIHQLINKTTYNVKYKTEDKMKGVILDFSIQQNVGVISGDDQNHYNFNGSDWREQSPPKNGDHVDFAITADGQAKDIYLAIQNTNQFTQNLSTQLNNLSNQNKLENQFNMIDWFVKCLKNYVAFSGRARRKEFWFFMLACVLLGIIARIIDYIIGTGELIDNLINLALFLPSLAVGARRLHDIGRSGWWQLLIFTIIGIIPLIIFWASETKKENNKWGQPAK